MLEQVLEEELSEHVGVSRAEEGGVEFQALGRYQHLQRETDKILGPLFLGGD